jgi:hypothetical protein
MSAAMIRSRPMYRACLVAAAVVTLVVGGALGSRADTVRVHKVVKPISAGTEFAEKADETASFPVSCLPRLGGGDDPLPLTGGRIKVGFAFFSYDDGTCTGYDDRVHRGSVVFRMRDIPHHFTAVTLVLKAETVNASDPNVKVPFGGIFEYVPPYWSAYGNIRYNAAADQTTAAENLGSQFNSLDITFADLDPSTYTTPFINPFPQPPYPRGIEETDPFNFRIDVTSKVKSWIEDWPNRNKTERHGFYFIGTDEMKHGIPTASNKALLVTYVVTLEFDIDEPDL